MAAWALALALCTWLAAAASKRARQLGRRWVVGVALAAALAPGCGQHEPDGPTGSEITELPADSVFFLQDAAGTPVTTVDARGEVTQEVSYHAYGSVRAEAGVEPQVFGFAGNERDKGSGLLDFKARPYRAELGIFLSPDPVPLFDPDGVLEVPNRAYSYVYAVANPYTLRDPSGQLPDLAIDVGFIAFDVTTLLLDNVVDGRTDNLAVNVVALGVDVGCAFIPVATGGGAAVRAGKIGAKYVDEVGVVLLHAGTKKTAQARVKAGQFDGQAAVDDIRVLSAAMRAGCRRGLTV